MRRPTRPCLLLALLLGFTAAAAMAAPRPNVLLITVDTLRADHLGAYGAREVQTPHLDRLARESTVFERAAAPMPITRPSHFSILTSLYPREHGVLNNATPLPETALTIAEILRDAGYRTGAFVAVTLLGPESGAGQGFEVLDGPRTVRQRDAREVVPAALDWLDGLGDDEPFFLWVHLFDPHQPYAPPRRFRRGLDPALAASMPSVAWPGLVTTAEANRGDVPERVLEHARALYRGEVESTDEWIGRLLGRVKKRRGLDGTVVVVTADHGECFEHGVFFEHAHCLFEGGLHIPLIIRHPPRFQPGARVAAPVSNIDVAPTILGAVGIERPAAFSGHDLHEQAAASRWILVQHPFYQRRAIDGFLRRRAPVRTVAGIPVVQPVHDVEKVGIVGTDWKYLRTGEAEEFYPMTPVPDETRPRSCAEAAACPTLRSALTREIDAHPLHVVNPGVISDDLRETLRALGYAE